MVVMNPNASRKNLNREKFSTFGISDISRSFLKGFFRFYKVRSLTSSNTKYRKSHKSAFSLLRLQVKILVRLVFHYYLLIVAKNYLYLI